MNEPPESIFKSLQAVICTMRWNEEKLALLKALKLAHVRGIFEEEEFSIIFNALLLFYVHVRLCII